MIGENTNETINTPQKPRPFLNENQAQRADKATQIRNSSILFSQRAVSSTAKLVCRRRFFPDPFGFIQQIALVIVQVTLERRNTTF